MAQTDVLNLLLELGGRATPRQISDLARQRFPTTSQWKYVHHDLTHLRKNGLVDRTFEMKSKYRRSREIVYFVVKK